MVWRFKVFLNRLKRSNRKDMEFRPGGRIYTNDAGWTQARRSRSMVF